jgi:hypothetical protein
VPLTMLGVHQQSDRGAQERDFRHDHQVRATVVCSHNPDVVLSSQLSKLR